MNKFLQDRKCIAIHQSISVQVFPQISGLRIWCSSGKFEHEMNLKGLLYLVQLDWRVK